MKYRIPLNNKELRVRKLIDILGCLKPFSNLAGRERDVFAEYIKEYLDKKDSLNKEEIFTILFDYNFTLYISNTLSDIYDKKISMDNVRNYTSKLRKKGLLENKSIPDKFLKLFEIIDNEITFSLEFKN